MSHSSKIFDEAPIKVQKKNGFDLSHLRVGSAKCGQLRPVLCKLLPPNTDFSLGVAMNVELPPLATSFFGRIDAIVEGFVTPCSILYGGWKQFISNQQFTQFPTTQNATKYFLPYFDLGAMLAAQDPASTSVQAIVATHYLNNDSILDSLGCRIDESYIHTGSQNASYKVSLMPLLCYHLIWDTFYRNKSVTRTIFAVNPNNTNNAANAKNVSLVWHSYYPQSYAEFQADATLRFPDGKWIWETRQRNYSRDYFTAGVPSPQQGNASYLQFTGTVDTSDMTSDNSFSISALRAANSLQKFLETNNLSGDYSEMIRNRWGTRPIDADFDEPYYLGRVIIPVYQKSVYQQDNSSSASAVNPFAQQGATGTRAAAGSFSGEGSICKRFHNSTWAYVMCLFSLVPHAMYGYGLNREMDMLDLGDFPAPELQSVGYENIRKSELFYNGLMAVGDPDRGDEDFAYIPRYSRFKYVDDTIDGELMPNRTLESFVLQRRFSSAPQLGTQFLEIPKNALDSVFAVSTENMNLSCWYEIFFEFKVSMPLAVFCIPTLGELENTYTIKTSVGGSRL